MHGTTSSSAAHYHVIPIPETLFIGVHPCPHGAIHSKARKHAISGNTPVNGRDCCGRHRNNANWSNTAHCYHIWGALGLADNVNIFLKPFLIFSNRLCLVSSCSWMLSLQRFSWRNDSQVAHRYGAMCARVYRQAGRGEIWYSLLLLSSTSLYSPNI